MKSFACYFSNEKKKLLVFLTNLMKKKNLLLSLLYTVCGVIGVQTVAEETTHKLRVYTQHTYVGPLHSLSRASRDIT